MAVYRSMGRGSWIVERKLLGLDVRKATGCYDEESATQVEETLLKLAKHGRRDLIAAFVSGQLNGPELVAGVDRHGVTFQLTVTSAVRLRNALYLWLVSAELADKTRREYRYGLSALVGKLPRLAGLLSDAESRSLERGPTLDELPALLAKYARRAKPVMFVQVKAAAQSFVRSTVPKGQHSELWRDVASVQGPKRKARNVQGGLNPVAARAVAERLGRLGPMWWTLCCTGMGRKEYWRTPWEVEPTHLLVHGTKRESRDRIVLRVTTPVRPFVSEQAFAEALRAVGRELGIGRLTIYVARRTFAHFLELAKIDDSRCDAYMGHAPKGMRGLYREHDVVPYLGTDILALRAAIGGEPVYVRALA